MEPTDDNLHGTFDQEQEEDLLSLPPAEGFTGPENSGDGGQISPLDEVPFIPAAVAEETSYAAATPAPLVPTHGTGAGQFSSNLSLSSTTSDQFDEEEVQCEMMSWEQMLHPLMAPDGLSNITNGGPAASHVDAVPPVVQQGTSTTADELPHPQQQLPLLMNDPEAQPWVRLDPHAALAPPMGSQAAPQDQEANILSRASTRRRAKSRGPPNRQQDWSGNLLCMGLDMILQLGRLIAKMKKDEEHRSSIVWQHFRRTSPCEYCDSVRVICPYCLTVMRNPSTIKLLRHLENIHQPPASSGARSSQALQITEIAKNPNGLSEPIETENNNNCATAARVHTQGTNAVVLSPRRQNHLPMDCEEQMATILSSLPCCKGPDNTWSLGLTEWCGVDEPESWWDLIIRLSDSSYCSSITKCTHDGFRLKFSNINEETPSQIVQVHPSAAWVHACEKPLYDGHAKVRLGTDSDTIGSSYLSVAVTEYDRRSAPDGYGYPWICMHMILRSLGFRKQVARDLVIFAFGFAHARNSGLRNLPSSDKGKSIVEQAGDVSSEKRKRKSGRRSKVWNHFTEVVEAGGSKVTMARCIHCGEGLKADSAKHGTTHLKRHIRSAHPEHAKSL